VRLRDVGIGHRPQHALANGPVSDADHLGRDAGSFGGEDLGRRVGVEAADQGCETGSVEVMHPGSGGRQLHGVSPFGGQVQVGPGDDVLPGACRESRKAEPPEYPAEPDLDADQFEPLVGGRCEHHVGDSGEALARDVDDLSVEDVAPEQDLVDAKGIGG
jgi:hypothetical protein